MCVYDIIIYVEDIFCHMLLTEILRISASIAHGMQQRESFPQLHGILWTDRYHFGL